MAVSLIVLLLSAVLIWAGGLNILAPGFIRDEFRGWGYPDWLRVGTGVTEWLAAVALVYSPLRLLGCGLALLVLIGVIVTFARTRQWMRMEYPLVLLALVLWVGAATVRAI